MLKTIITYIRWALGRDLKARIDNHKAAYGALPESWRIEEWREQSKKAYFAK